MMKILRRASKIASEYLVLAMYCWGMRPDFKSSLLLQWFVLPLQKLIFLLHVVITWIEKEGDGGRRTGTMVGRR